MYCADVGDDIALRRRERKKKEKIVLFDDNIPGFVSNAFTDRGEGFIRGLIGFYKKN